MSASAAATATAAAASAAAAAAPYAGPVTVLVTGASRGIGLGLIELYAKQPNVTVVGTARDLKGAAKLNALVKAHPKRVIAVPLDVSDSKSISALPAALSAVGVTSLDVLINNAGVLSGVPRHDGNSPLSLETVENLLSVYRTNVVGPWEVTTKVLPLLRAAPSKRAHIVNVSSLLGQFECNINGPFPAGGLAYRSSKVSLNTLSALQAREYNHATVTAQDAARANPNDSKLAAAAAAAAPIITVLTVHPGIIDTEIQTQSAGKIPKELLRPVEDSAVGIDKAWRQSAAAAVANPKVKFVDALTQQEMAW